MARGRPWYKRSGGDFVMGVLAMPDSDHKWAYSAIIDMLNDRDRPIPDEPAFICGFTGLSRKKWSLVRRYLLDHGKLVEVSGGNLSNPRFEEERQTRAAEHDRAVEHGREGGRKSAAARQGQLDLDPAPPRAPARTRARSGEDQAKKTGDSTPESTPDSAPDTSETRPPAPLKKPDKIQPPPQATRARKRLDKNIDSTHPTTEESEGSAASSDGTGDEDVVEPVVPRLRNADLMALYDAVCDASGFATSSPGGIDRAMKQVEAWRADGIDFDEVVIPVIKRTVADAHEPTRVLGRFDKAIRHEHARAKALNGQGRRHVAPPSPILEPPDEDPRFRPLRALLLKELGNDQYCRYANEARFEAVSDAAGDRKPLRVRKGRSHLSLLDGDTGPVLRGAARAFGFTEVW